MLNSSYYKNIYLQENVGSVVLPLNPAAFINVVHDSLISFCWGTLFVLLSLLWTLLSLVNVVCCWNGLYGGVVWLLVEGFWLFISEVEGWAFGDADGAWVVLAGCCLGGTGVEAGAGGGAVGVGRNISNLQVGHVWCRWNQLRKHDVWNIWLHGNFLAAITLYSKKIKIKKI